MELEECKWKAVGMLRRYNDNLVQIKMLEVELEELDEYTPANMAVSYDQPGGGKTNKVNSVVENDVVQRQEEREQIIIKLRTLKRWQRKIDIALDNMSREKRILLQMRYIDGRYWKEIAETVGYEEYYVKKELKEKAIETLACHLFSELSRINLFAEM